MLRFNLYANICIIIVNITTQHFNTEQDGNRRKEKETMNKDLLQLSQELAAITSQLETLMIDIEVASTAGIGDPVIQENTDHALKIANAIRIETSRISSGFYEMSLDENEPDQSGCLLS